MDDPVVEVDAMRANEPKQRNVTPEESPGMAWPRRLILFAFWVVVVAFGLPHWIYTTSIHRSSLPLEVMNAWAEGNACQLHYPLFIKIYSDSGIEEAQSLAPEVGRLLKADPHLSLLDFHIAPKDSNDTTTYDAIPAAQRSGRSEASGREEIALTISVQTDTSVKSTQAELWTWAPVLEIRHNPGRGVDRATLAPFISHEVRRIFAEDANTIPYMLEDSHFTTKNPYADVAPEAKANLDARSTRAFKYASTYHLTFSLFTSSALPSAWEIEEALEKTIKPLLDRMSTVSQFTVDTQVQLYASFSPSIAGPQYDDNTREWKLQRSDLSGFINAAEWPLNPGIGSGPTINFVLFVPSEDQSPLVLAESGGSSWLIPQWGGVQIMNPTGKQPASLSANDLQPVMLTFADQLSSLLGLPQTPSSLVLRIASLTRERATSIILSAASTLGALSRLTLKLQSIAIPDSVAISVDKTIVHLGQACRDLSDGKYHDALINARIAEDEAEQAFFEPSMVGQVYFPDEHKVAVYVPLLGPMAVPLVLALIKEIKVFVEKMEASRAAKSKGE